MDTSGYVKINAQIIIDVYKVYKEDFYSRRDSAKEEYIRKQMTKKWFPAKTERQAEKRGIDCYGIIAWNVDGYRELCILEELSEMAELAINNPNDKKCPKARVIISSSSAQIVRGVLKDLHIR